ncbi:helix-turn-helix domain-containing protein [Halovivax limisalsi]|uniref:helix-turn-helix domain-containing protein n=1 Tax=Halovivax limisalsi TaxID=1453760 RepID=UPI001FFC9DEA|nr:helix-turn-helix domain-containing protein [Halovivax limisalsi]
MSTIAEFRIPATDLALADAFDRIPDLTVQLESSISRTVPSMWIAGDEPPAVSEALAADDSVAGAELLIETPERLLYDVEPTPETRTRFDRLLEADATVLDATGRSGWWQLEMRFPDRNALAATHDRLDEAGTAIEIVRVSQLGGRPTAHPRLTPEQREALVAAFEHGYFEIPRRTSMEELADELGISHQALSERLRRAYETLVDAELQPAGEYAP